jgi:hypothetical protein
MSRLVHGLIQLMIKQPDTCDASTPFRSISKVTTRRISQFRFSFYRKPVQVDFSGGQITSDAGLLPLRAFDERDHLTRDWAALLDDPALWSARAA